MYDPGVVEQHVDRLRRARERLDGRGIGLVVCVALDAAELAGDRSEPFPVAVGDHDPRSVRVERACHHAPEPARSAGHEDGAPGEVEVSRLDPGHHESPMRGKELTRPARPSCSRTGRRW